MRSLLTVCCFLVSVACCCICLCTVQDAREEHRKCIRLLRQYEQRFQYLQQDLEGYMEYEDIKKYFEEHRYGLQR